MVVVMTCLTHKRKFSEHFDANFHEQLNIGCKWVYNNEQSFMDKLLNKLGCKV